MQVFFGSPAAHRRQRWITDKDGSQTTIKSDKDKDLTDKDGSQTTTKPDKDKELTDNKVNEVFPRNNPLSGQVRSGQVTVQSISDTMTSSALKNVSHVYAVPNAFLMFR